MNHAQVVDHQDVPRTELEALRALFVGAAHLLELGSGELLAVAPTAVVGPLRVGHGAEDGVASHKTKACEGAPSSRPTTMRADSTPQYRLHGLI